MEKKTLALPYIGIITIAQSHFPEVNEYGDKTDQ